MASSHGNAAGIAGSPPLRGFSQRSAKPAKERIRVSRACDLCKKKKIRCSGRLPCRLCLQDSRQCTYNAPYARGKRRGRPNNNTSVPSGSSPLVATSTGNDRSTEPGADIQGDAVDAADQHARLAHEPDHTIALDRGPGDSSRASPDPGESDRQGHFVGASSGLSFLLRLQRRLNENAGGASQTSVFTLGDPALPVFDEFAFALPARHDAETLLKVYFELASPTYRFLHRPTIESWMQQLYDRGAISEPHSHSKYAVVLSMLAQASRYSGDAEPVDSANGLLYFQAAEQQLARQTESATLITAQAFLGCCFFVMTCSRLNHCWSLFGTTSRLILALGLHRRTTKFAYRHNSPPDYIESESRKRLFWCAYVLDKSLSTIFGRPCALQDHDMDQELPSLVDDRDLTSQSMTTATGDNMNVMLGPLQQQKLGQILNRILRRLYGIKALDRATRYRTMAELGSDVEAWRRGLPAFLDPEKVDSRLLRPLFQRQSNLLNLGAGHAEILIYRPCLFDDYKRRPHTGGEDTNVNVQKCLNAAMSIVSVIDRMAEAQQLFAASWVAHYQAFCAVAVLYTFTIKNSLDDRSTWFKYFRAAERCQGLIAMIKSRDSLAQRFILIMEEYRLEVVQKLQHDSPATPAISSSQLSPTLVNPGFPLAREADQGKLPTFTDLPNWEQLDSLALDLGDILPDMDMIYQGPL